MISHNWRELVSSGRSVCRCHVVFLWCYVCSVFLSFSSSASIKAAALNGFEMHAPRQPHTVTYQRSASSLILFLFCFLGGVAFSEFSIAYYRFRFCMEGTLYVLLPDRCFLPCNHGLEFDVRLGQNSVNQSINQSKTVTARVALFKEKSECIQTFWAIERFRRAH